MEGSEAAAAHPSGIIPTLQNIVATVNLGCKLELKKIAMGARNAEYNPKRFAAVIMRIREPKTTALIFASGKMVRLHSMCCIVGCSTAQSCPRLQVHTGASVSKSSGQVCTGAKSEEDSKLAARKARGIADVRLQYMSI